MRTSSMAGSACWLTLLGVLVPLLAESPARGACTGPARVVAGLYSLRDGNATWQLDPGELAGVSLSVWNVDLCQVSAFDIELNLEVVSPPTR